MTVALQRSAEPILVNALANDPAIRPTIGGDTKLALDLTAAVEDDKNIVLMGEHGGFILVWCAPHVYEVHTLIKPEGRGPWAHQAAECGFGIMFDAYGAKHIWTRVLSTASNVRNFTIAAGFKPCGEEVFDLGDGPKVYNLYERKP